MSFSGDFDATGGLYDPSTPPTDPTAVPGTDQPRMVGTSGDVGGGGDPQGEWDSWVRAVALYRQCQPQWASTGSEQIVQADIGPGNDSAGFGTSQIRDQVPGSSTENVLDAGIGPDRQLTAEASSGTINGNPSTICEYIVIAVLRST